MGDETRAEFEAQRAASADRLFDALDHARDKMNCHRRREIDLISAEFFNIPLADWIAMFDGDD